MCGWRAMDGDADERNLNPAPLSIPRQCLAKLIKREVRTQRHGKSTTPSAVVPAAIVEEAWQQVGASFERFCLTAGIATLAGMMDWGRTRLGCAASAMVAMTERIGIAGGGPRESWASTGARSSWSGSSASPRR